MSALLSGIHDRSSVMQKAFAFALGHLVRVRCPSPLEEPGMCFVVALNDQQPVPFMPYWGFTTIFFCCVPLSDGQGQQCGEAAAEAQHLEPGEGG